VVLEPRLDTETKPLDSISGIQ